MEIIPEDEEKFEDYVVLHRKPLEKLSEDVLEYIKEEVLPKGPVVRFRKEKFTNFSKD